MNESTDRPMNNMDPIDHFDGIYDRQYVSEQITMPNHICGVVSVC